MIKSELNQISTIKTKESTEIKIINMEPGINEIGGQ